MDKYETFWPRFFALILDGIVLAILDMVLFYLIPFEHVLLSEAKVLALVHSLLIQNAQYAYIIIMIGAYGQTLGKMALGIKVLDNATEEPVSYSQSFMREFVPFSLVNISIIGRIILGDVDLQNFELSTIGYIMLVLPSSMLGIWSLLEIVTMLLDKKNRALHDKIAGTVVVKV